MRVGLLALVVSGQMVHAVTKCGLTSSEAFKSWTDSFETDSPKMYPTTEASLASMIATAKANGCKVRPVGTAHSFDGVVRQKTEQQTVVVSLADYTPPAAWNNVLVGGANPTVRMGAGKTFLDLMNLVRPQGYLMKSQTAGLFFSLGGVFMNPSVHGGTFGQDRLCSLVTAARVMKGDGTVVDVTDANEIKKLRGSMGLAGIVLAVEIALRQDTGVKMNFAEQVIAPWTQAAFNAFMTSSMAGQDAGEWFYNPYNDKMQAMTIDYDGAPGYNYAATQSQYASQLSQYPTLAKTGSIISPLNQFLANLNEWNQQGKTLLEIGGLLMDQGFTVQKDAWLANYNSGPRDAYFISPGNLVIFDNVQTFIKCVTDCVADGIAFQAVTAARTVLKTAIAASGNWMPTLPCEFRFVDVSANTLVLEHLAPGRYISMECVNLRAVNGEQNYHGPFWQQIEDAWRTITSGGAPEGHHGKEWGMGPLGALPRPYPFQMASDVSAFYTSATKSAFIAAMNAYDAQGVFRAGEGLRLLGLSSVTFDAREYHGGDCSTFKDAGCINGCCCQNILGCWTQSYNKCTDTKRGFLKLCSMNCECASNNCWAGLCLW